MEDGLAREGVLTRCNQDRDATLTDEECANARRASTAIALEAERAREPELERESEVKLLALRERDFGQNVGDQEVAASSAPAFGTPVGAIMPSMSQSALFDAYAEGAEPLGRRPLEVEEAEPPPNDLAIESPQLVFSELEIPAPFAGDAAAQ